MRRTLLFTLALLIPLALVADDYPPGPPMRADFEVQYSRPVAYTPGPPLRTDFEVQYARPAGSYVEAPPLRTDFEVQYSRPAERYAAGPPLREDFMVQYSRPAESYAPGPGMRVDFAVAYHQPPFIGGYDYDGTCPRKGGRLVVVGERFGESQGNRRLVMEGGGTRLTLSVGRWSATEIALTLPDDPRIVPGVSGGYSIGIQDENGTWISNTDRRFSVCP